MNHFVYYTIYTILIDGPYKQFIAYISLCVIEYSTNLNFKFVSLFLIPAESKTLLLDD